ncbi:ankyrin [Annulohypoxylon truncatum]|uniref:ankyrin n=1 Tax=Annulohypoxylon truncatum TaxID=327061 RepID=UPI00200873A9|nr:ankyrin [Annulohypoxylon truncatum]KAI1213181.1 ankyrin [Annulohypoxylon truncatum]
MEAIGVGANVLAFVVLALKAAKTTYETLSAVKDGPEIVRHVAANVNQLYWILDGLQRSRVAIDDNSLAGHLQESCKKLNLAASFIEKLQIPPGERHAGKIWKRLKTFFSEKELERLNDELAYLVGILHLRLQGISSNAVHNLQKHCITTEQTIGVLRDAIQTQTRVQETSFSNLREGICGAVDARSETILTRLSTVSEDIAARARISQSQGDSMRSLLEEIKGLLVTSPNQHQTGAAGATGGESSNSCHVMEDDDGELIQSIDRLCGLIHDKERTINTYTYTDDDDDEESKGIIEDLQTILQSAYQRGELIESRQTHAETKQDGKALFKSISRRFERGFDQYEIQINQGVGNQTRPQYRITNQKHAYQKIRLDVGTLTLMFNHRTRSSGTIEPHQNTEEKTYSDYSITSTFFPNDPQRFHMWVASTFQRETDLGAISSISRLSVNRVLPYGSRVFKVVEDGDLRELQRMLQNGKASLRDHDEYGASLLFYSMLQPQMCKFLVEKGLDVDHVSGLCDGHKPYTKCALQIHPSDFEINPDKLTKRQSCRRILLEAGADPTLAPSTFEFSYLCNICAFGNSDSIRLAFNPELTGHITSINTFSNDYGQSPLLIHCHEENYDKETLRTMLDLGADIHARDRELNTCLHVCFNSQLIVLYRDLRQFEAIKYLIQMGADVRAVNKFGFTVSDYAYRRNQRVGTFNDGKVTGDLWDSALQSCGYDVAEFRTEKYCRRAQYTEDYKREDFEQLWQGREHLCPYWDDLPWPSSEVYSTKHSNPSEDLEDSEDPESWDSDTEDGGVPLTDGS